MQINRDERLAKTQAFGMLAVMALVAVTVHFWPRETAVATPSRRVVAVPAAVAADRQPAPRASMAVTVPVRRLVPRSVALVEPATPELPLAFQRSTPVLAPLEFLPGAPIAIPAVPAPTAGNGAVTGAMQKTGRSLAGAFKKTGRAFRRTF